jgi:V/A-type H+-transporting ATPase subunit I
MAHVKIESSSSKPPVVLRNPRVIRNFEMMTEMFGLPGKGEIDPTIFMAITFSFFFGFMLTDAVYGLILLIFSVALLRGIGRVNKGMRDFSIILIGGSLVAIATGIAMGSYLGDFLKYLGVSVPKLVDPLSGGGVKVILTLSILIGLAHVWIGFLIGLVQKLRLGLIKEAISDQLSWMILIPSGAILVCQFMGWISLGWEVLLFPAVFFGASVIILLSTRGPVSIMNIFSTLGNILSYSRLMALALMTGAIALVVNLLAGMAWGLGIFGVALAALVFVGGHTVNLALNALGGFIHSMRLHYVEFFGKFYTGEGPSFKPFKVERNYTTTGVSKWY